MTNLAKHYQNAITYAYSEETLMVPSNIHIETAINNRVDFGYGLAKTPGALLFVPKDDEYAEPYTAVGEHPQVVEYSKQEENHITGAVAFLARHNPPRTLCQTLVTDYTHDPSVADRCDHVGFKFLDHGITNVRAFGNVPAGEYRIVSEHEDVCYGGKFITTYWLLPR